MNSHHPVSGFSTQMILFPLPVPPRPRSFWRKSQMSGYFTDKCICIYLYFLPRIFTGSTRLDGNAIGKYLTHLWNCRASCYNCLTITNEASRVLLGLACSWLCPLAVCRVHGRAGFPPPPPHVQLAEDRGDLLLQHESDPTAVVPNMACDWRSLQ